MAADPVVTLVMATRLEAQPFIDRLRLTALTQKPFATYGRDGLRLILSGIGKANAAMATAYACDHWQPPTICNLGAAGAVRTGIPLGAVRHVTRIIEYDRPLFATGRSHRHRPEVLEGFETGTLATGDRPVIDPAERVQMARKADLVDMEAAAVVQAGRRFAVPCRVFKFVSDTVEHTRDNQIVDNIRRLRGAFFEFWADQVRPRL